MWVEGCDPDEEWKQWKLIPSTVTDKDICQLEHELGVHLPNVLKCFFTTYFHLFETPVGRHSSEKPFESIKHAWNPTLVKAGYLPFTWDEDYYFIRCIDLANMPKEENCPICEIDHEILFNFDEKAGREELKPSMRQIADNFIEYLNGLLQ